MEEQVQFYINLQRFTYASFFSFRFENVLDKLNSITSDFAGDHLEGVQEQPRL